MTDAADFVTKVLNHFPPPYTWTPEKKTSWSREVGSRLAGLGKDVLDQAFQILVDNGGRTPEVKDINNAVKVAKTLVEGRKRSGRLDFSATHDDVDRVLKDTEIPPDDRIERAELLINGPLGRRAADEGWINPLFHWVVKHGRLPREDFEIRSLSHRRNDHLATMEMARAKNHPCLRSVLELGWKIEADCKRLAEIAHGRPVPSRDTYITNFMRDVGDVLAKVKTSPASRYADENLEEGRGNKGMTA